MGRTSLTHIPEGSHERDFVAEKKRYEDAKKAYEEAQNISQEEELKQGKIQNLNQTLNSSHASQEQSQSQSQSQQFQASDNEEEKGEPSLQKGRLGVENDQIHSPSGGDNPTNQNKYPAQSQSNQNLLQ